MTRAPCCAGTGDVPSASTILSELQGVAASGALSMSAIDELGARVAFAGGDLAKAAKLLQKATDGLEALGYGEPPLYYYPTWDCLGYVRLQSGDLAGASSAFNTSLAVYPESGWALYGLEAVANAAGQTARAASLRQQRAAAWANADVEMTSPCPQFGSIEASGSSSSSRNDGGVSSGSSGGSTDPTVQKNDHSAGTAGVLGARYKGATTLLAVSDGGSMERAVVSPALCEGLACGATASYPSKGLTPLMLVSGLGLTLALALAAMVAGAARRACARCGRAEHAGCRAVDESAPLWRPRARAEPAQARGVCSLRL